MTSTPPSSATGQLVAPRQPLSPLEVSRFRRAAWLLIAAFIAFLPTAVLTATLPFNAALRAEATDRGIQYTNGSLPADVYAQVVEANPSPLEMPVIILGIALFATFAAGIALAAAARRPTNAWGIASTVAAILSGVFWVAMLVLDLNVRLDGGTGFSADYWRNWLLAEGLMAVFAALAVLLFSLGLSDLPIARRSRIVVLAISSLALAGSLALITQGGLPPLIPMLLSAVLGLVLLIGTRKGSPTRAAS
jgi:hypothetical protein